MKIGGRCLVGGGRRSDTSLDDNLNAADMRRRIQKISDLNTVSREVKRTNMFTCRFTLSANFIFSSRVSTDQKTWPGAGGDRTDFDMFDRNELLEGRKIDRFGRESTSILEGLIGGVACDSCVRPSDSDDNSAFTPPLSVETLAEDAPVELESLPSTARDVGKLSANPQTFVDAFQHAASDASNFTSATLSGVAIAFSKIRVPEEAVLAIHQGINNDDMLRSNDLIFSTRIATSQTTGSISTSLLSKVRYADVDSADSSYDNRSHEISLSNA